VEDGRRTEQGSNSILSQGDLVFLGARLFDLLQRGATLRECLSLLASAGGIAPDEYFDAVWGVLDGRGLPPTIVASTTNSSEH